MNTDIPRVNLNFAQYEYAPDYIVDSNIRPEGSEFK